MKKSRLLDCLFIVLFLSCKTAQISTKHQVEINFLHVNDVYEISSLEGGKVG